jgi:hypothetical protein
MAHIMINGTGAEVLDNFIRLSILIGGSKVWRRRSIAMTSDRPTKAN